MDVKIVNLPAIDIIGREGLCTKEHNIVSELWTEANAHFAEVITSIIPDKGFASFRRGLRLCRTGDRAESAVFPVESFEEPRVEEDK